MMHIPDFDEKAADEQLSAYGKLREEFSPAPNLLHPLLRYWDKQDLVGYALYLERRTVSAEKKLASYKQVGWGYKDKNGEYWVSAERAPKIGDPPVFNTESKTLPVCIKEEK